MRAALRRDGLYDPRLQKCGHPVHHPVGRPQRRAQAGGCGGPSGPEPQRPRDLLPDGGYRGLQLGSRPGRTARPGHGGGGRRAGGIRPAGAGPQHQAQPAVRAQLRVFLGGPVPLRQAGRGLRARHPVQRHRRLPQALRRQQPGAAPHGVGLRRRRANPAGALPDRL